MRTLKLNLYYDCTAKCDHCRFHCSNTPAQGEPDYDTPYALARSLWEHCGLDMAVVLGGEPSIYAERTHALLAKLAALGLHTRLETNACWAGSYGDAAAFLKPLRESGTQFMFSLDSFHEPYVPFGNVVNAVRAATDLEVPYVLEIPYLNPETKAHPLDRRTLELETEIRAMFPEIAAYVGGVLFIGRAADRFGDEFATGRGVPTAPCTAAPWWQDGELETTDLLIYEPGGWLTKGCGIAIGNVLRQDPVALVKGYSARENPILGRLLEGGPLALAREAEACGYTLKADYADPCHLCHEARSALWGKYPDTLQPENHYLKDAANV